MPEYQYVEVGTNTQAPTETIEQKYERLYAAQQQLGNTVNSKLDETVTALKAELDAIKQAATPKETPKPPDPDSTGVNWLDTLRKGQYKDADNMLSQTIEQRLQNKFEEVRQKAYQDALAATQINLEIDRYLNKVRTAPENADILQFESYLEGPVSRKVEAAKAAGKVKTQSDFLEIYKTAVDEEVSNLRNKVLQIRGQGKQEGQIRNQQVISSTPLAPQQVQSVQGTQAPDQLPNDPVEDYFAKRRLQEQRNHGMA